MSDQRAVQRACRSALAARVASFARPRRAVKSPTPHSGAPKARGLTAMARTERSFTLPQKHVVIGHCPTDRVPNFTAHHTTTGRFRKGTKGNLPHIHEEMPFAIGVAFGDD